MALTPDQEQRLVHGVAEGVKIIGGIASVEEKVMPWAMMIAGLVPGAATVLGAIALAQPYIDKAAEYAPQVANLVDNEGVPVLDAINRVAPPILDHVKNAITTLRSSDPTLSHVTAAEIADAVAAEAFKGLFGDVFKNSEFTPQDARFGRTSISDA